MKRIIASITQRTERWGDGERERTLASERVNDLLLEALLTLGETLVL